MKTKLFAVFLILVVLMTNISSFALAASSGVTTLISTADSYIDSANPGSNFGSIVTLWIRGNSPTRRGLLRFDLTAIPANAQISSAVLKLFVSSDGSTVAGSVNAVSGSWTENTVTYSTAPQVGAFITTLPDPASPNLSVSVDLTSFVVGKSLVDFYLTSSNTDGVVYYTREKGAAKAPQLIVTWTTEPAATVTPTSTTLPSLTPTSTNPPISTETSMPANTVTVTTPAPNPVLAFTPIADAYIQADQPTKNFGSASQLISDGSPVKNLLLKFTVSGVGTRSILSARLRLYCVDPSPIGGEFHRVPDTTWGESTINWNNAPLADASGFATLRNVRASTWYEVNVTSFVTGDGTFSFSARSTSTDGAYYSSKEGTPGFAPQLVITTSDSAPSATAIVTSTFTSVATLTNTPTTTPSAIPTFAPTFTPTITATPLESPTPQPIGSDPVIMAAGDIVCSTLTTNLAGCQQMAVSQVVLDQQPAAALILGDLCHTPSVNCFDNYFNPSWGRLFSIAHPIPGNHDYLVAGALYYFDYWNGIGNTVGSAGDRSQGYYSFDIGDWHLIALNSQCSDAGGCTSGSPQYLWLQQDLQAHPNLCTLAYYHIPVFSSGARAENNMRQIYTLLYNNNVDVVLDGHDHIYERFVPQDPNGLADPLRGIREFIVGTGGSNHTAIVSVQPNSEVRNADTFGALKLTLHPDGYDWQFLPIPGKTFTDAGSALCH